jgi:glycosyltransferase involved in cell wall biosynthesis
VADHFPAARLVRRRSDRRVWFLDAYEETDGASRALQRVARLAGHHGRELTILTSLPEAPAVEGVAWHNFPPVGRFTLPETRDQVVSFPPFLEILEYCEREGVVQAIVSTPGPMGLVGLATSRLLGLELAGIYQTDIPLHVRFLTASPSLEEMSWSYLRWFFGRADRVYAPHRASLDELAARGFAAAKLRLLPTGVDREQFAPSRRDPAIWPRFGLSAGRFKFLYVGRISEEKNLDGLLRAFMGFVEAGHQADLVVVGDGPYLGDLQSRYRRPEILFTGFRDGEELAAVYASADLFLYPTETDGSGTAVLEAMASGLPVVVSRDGGSRELVEALGGGRVVDTRQAGELRRVMTELFLDPAARRRLARFATDGTAGHDWGRTLTALWAESVPGDELKTA